MPGHRLLQPLARVARRDPGPACELVRVERVGNGERGVETQPIAEVHAEQLESSERGAEEALDERVPAVLRGGRSHACLLVERFTSP